ncbi:MAG: hypothetical protein AAF640_02845 [Pseudomonadota bacterium]
MKRIAYFLATVIVLNLDWRDSYRSDGPASLRQVLPRVRRWFSFREFARGDLTDHYRFSAQTVSALGKHLGRAALLELATRFPRYRSFNRSLELALADSCGDCASP